jgi:hypothetical protein
MKPGKGYFFIQKIFMSDVAVNFCNSHYLSDPPVAEVDHNIHIAPFSIAPLQQAVMRVVGSNEQKCSIISVATGKQVNADVY